MPFRKRLFFIFLIYGLLLALGVELFMFNINKDLLQKRNLEEVTLYAKNLQKSFHFSIEESQKKLQTLRTSAIFRENFEKNRITKYSQQLFVDIAKTSSIVMQLRYIDNQGNERIRVERKEPDGAVVLTPKEKLQNKANRYYFQEIMKLDEGEFWFSKLDLNVEQGSIEKPIKPVLRIGMPYYYKGKKEGILVLNIFMKSFLNLLVSSKIYTIYLLDKDNYTLVNTLHKNEWNRYLGEKKPLETTMSAEAVVLDLELDNKEELKIIISPNKNYLEEQLRENLQQFFFVLLVVLILSFPLSYFMSIVPARLSIEVDNLNKKLKKQIQERDVLLSLFDRSDAVLFKWNNDENWSVSFVSKSVEKLLEYKQEDFQTNRIAYASCIHKDDIARVQKEVEEAVTKRLYFFTHKPYRVITKSNKVKWIYDNTVIVRDDTGNIINFVGYLTDITELKAKELELENLARIDQLTKISNRLYLDEVLLKQYYRFNRYGEICSFILVDIDHFKEVNDTYGHIVGDKILIEFAQLLQKSVRKDDIVGRSGGEEFLIILPHTSLRDAQILAEKLLQRVNSHTFSVVKHKTASFGVATIKKGLTIEECINLADQALYEAKKAGRNCVKVAE